MSPADASPAAEKRSGRLARYQQLAEAQTADLPLFVWVQAAVLAVGLLAAKASAVALAFGGAALDQKLAALWRGAPVECLLAGSLFLATLLARRLPALTGRGRGAVVAGVLLGVLALLACAFVGVEFFAAWGAPFSGQLLELAPALYRYILMVGLSDSAGTLTLGALLALGGVLGAPVLVSWLRPRITDASRWRPLAWLPAVGLLSVGAVALSLPPRSYREGLVRKLNVLEMFDVSGGDEGLVAVSERSEREERLLRELLGPASDEAARALAPLRGRRLNVVVWVWESVGQRYLRSLHPLGLVATPRLDAAMARGSVEMTRAYTESPLTVQTTWALVTGRSPPAKPFVFALYGHAPDVPLPPHGEALHGLLKQAGYRTGMFNSSYTEMWSVDRVFELGPLDAFEDHAQLASGQVSYSGIGVDDNALRERAAQWVRGAEPFFAWVWNVETHVPYTWVGMPARLEQADRLERYLATIERADAIFGDFYDELVRSGLDESTLVILVGDHGQGLGRGPRPWTFGHAFYVYEDDLHVPLVFLHPSLAAASPTRSQRVDTLCTHTDLYPTILDLLGLPVPGDLDGRSLARTYEPRPFFARSVTWWPQTVRAGRYKLILPEVGAAPSLHDVVADPWESRDISAEEPEIATVLASELARWHNERFTTDPTFGYRYMSDIPFAGFGPGSTAAPNALEPADPGG